MPSFIYRMYFVPEFTSTSLSPSNSSELLVPNLSSPLIVSTFARLTGQVRIYSFNLSLDSPHITLLPVLVYIQVLTLTRTILFCHSPVCTSSKASESCISYSGAGGTQVSSCMPTQIHWKWLPWLLEKCYS